MILRTFALLLTILGFALTTTTIAFAQNSTNDRVLKLAEPDFTLVVLPTSLRVPRHQSVFRVTHRFLETLGDAGASSLFGIDSGAQIGLHAGGDVAGARRVASLGGLTPHLALAVNDVNSVFQVNAQTFGDLDHTRLQTDGETFSVSSGASYSLTDRVTVTVDVFYSPLTVRRTFDGPNSIDGLFNARGLLSYRVR